MTPGPPTDPLASAAAHAGLGLPAAAPSFPKRVIIRLTRFFVEPQRAYNQGVVDALLLLRDDHRRLADRVGQAEQAAEHTTAGTQAELKRLEQAIIDGGIAAGLTRAQVVDLAGAVRRIEGQPEPADGTAREPRRPDSG